jgi:hypothetical protein
MEHGAWCKEHGAWCKEHGAWCKEHGAWCDLPAAICPLPSALCTMPSALCPLPHTPGQASAITASAVSNPPNIPMRNIWPKLYVRFTPAIQS